MKTLIRRHPRLAVLVSLVALGLLSNDCVSAISRVHGAG